MFARRLARARTDGWSRFNAFALQALLPLLLLPITLSAQEIRGTVVSPDNASPAAGVVVLLVHATRNDSIIARSITDERGFYSLKAPTDGTVRLRALRIGYEPMNVGTYALRAGSFETVRIVLDAKRLQLAAYNVKDTKRCEVRPDGAQLVSQLFLQARTALLATTAKATGAQSTSLITNFTRTEDARGKLVAPVERSTHSLRTTQPYMSIPVETLTKSGYVVKDRDGMTYYAPDANVLLSDAFALQHCLQLEEGTGLNAGLIGIGFRPANRPRNLVEVTGTLWLDRASSELRYLEYAYDQLPVETRRANLGGRVDYTRLSNGTWFISEWSIRTPILAEEPSNFQSTLRGSGAPRIAVAGLRISGGEVQSVRVDENVLYANFGAALAGAAPNDPASMVKLANAETIDSTNAPVASCKSSPRSRGLVYGRVTNGGPLAVANAEVAASWQTDFRSLGDGGYGWENRRVTTTSLSDGRYTMCDLPLMTSVSMSAMKERRTSRITTARLTPGNPSVEIDLAIDMSVRSTMDSIDVSNEKGGRIRVRPRTDTTGVKARGRSGP